MSLLSCLKYFLEAKLKCFDTIPLAEEISRVPSRDSYGLLVLTLMKIYKEKEKAE